MDIFFRQWWNDPRLAHNFSIPFNMAGDATKLIWTPDTFFWNVKVAKYHRVTRENMRIKIHGDGKVYFSTRCAHPNGTINKLFEVLHVLCNHVCKT